MHSEILKLYCWIHGEDARRIFSVEISNTETVASLRRAIKNEKPVDFRDVDASSLDLYVILLPDMNDMDDEQLGERLKSLSTHDKQRLSPRAKLSEVFPKSTFSDDIETIVVGVIRVPTSPVSSIVTRSLQLNCLVLGDNSNRMFTVAIAETANVGDLKTIIKQQRENTFRKVDAVFLDLYQVSLLDDEELDEKLRHIKLNAPLRPGRKLSTCFAHISEDHLHILISQRAEHDDAITALAECESLFSQYRPLSNIVQTAFKLTLIQAAKPREYVEIQSGHQKILDGRYATSDPINTLAPPIKLFHPAFAYFSSKAFDSEYNVPNDFARSVWDLVAEFTLIRPGWAGEIDRRIHFMSFIQSTILVDGPTRIWDTFITTPPPDEALPVYLIVDGEKNAPDDGVSDPSVRATLSFLRRFGKNKNKQLRLKCCFPVFIIVYSGPWLTIMGGIVTTNFVVQRLTDFLWIPVHSVCDAGQCHRIARVLYALKESIARLDSWYKSLTDVPSFNPLAPAVHPRFFPSPNTYLDGDAVQVKFAYQRPLERNVSCATYLAKTLQDDPKDIIVRFVTSYSVDAHQKMVSLGLAPPLLYHGPINVSPDLPSYGELRMVVMEFAKALVLEDALKQRRIPSRLQADLCEALEQLHDAGYVFGDLRQPSVIVTPEETSTAQLINFDWAGKEGKVKYPACMSSTIDRPEGVQELELIRKEHDLMMLEWLIYDCARY